MDEQEGEGKRWLKLGLIAAVVVALIIAVVMMLAGGEHGPARHFGLGAP